MAAKVTLVRGGTIISLQGGANKIWLREDGWIRTVARRGVDSQWPELVSETLTCLVQASSHDDLAAVIQGVNEILRQAGDFIEDNTDDNPVYLRVQLTNESNDYETLVTGGHAEPADAFYNWPVDTDDTLPTMIVEITRRPFWEQTGAESSFTMSAVNSYGEIVNHATNIPGDVPARAVDVTVTADSVTGLSEFWLGWRSNRFGDRTDFQPVWSLDDSDTLSNNTAVAGSIIRWTPGGGADDLILERAIISVASAISPSSEYAAQRGRFIVLLRALASSTRTFRARMSLGLLGGSQWDTRARVLINSNSYFWYSLGEIAFPIAGRLIETSESSGFQSQSIRLEAEVAVDGAGTLDMDRLILIPISEGMLHIKSVLSISASGANKLVHITDADGEQTSETRSVPVSNVTMDYPQHDHVMWGLPPGAGSAIFAGQDLAVSRTTDTVDIFTGYRERWLTLGGAG